MFFTLLREIMFALHKMYEVSGLEMGDLPYEEYISTMEELHQMKKDAALVYEMYWKVLCHFHIYAQMTKLRSGGTKQMAWASHLF